MTRTLEGITADLESACDYLETITAEMVHNAYCNSDHMYGGIQVTNTIGPCKEKSHKFTSEQYQTWITEERRRIAVLETEYRALGGK